MAKWAELFPAGRIIPEGWDYEDSDPDVELIVDNKPLSYSAQHTGVTKTGQLTVDTFLDQIVFGMPVTGFDLWQ